MSFATKDRFSGKRSETEVKYSTNTTPDGGEGSLSYDGTSFRLQDQLGVFDPRSGAGGSSVNFGIASFNTLGDDEHEIRLSLGVQAQNVVFSAVVDVDNGKDAPANWHIIGYTIDATGINVHISIVGDDFIHDDEDYTLEFEYVWR